MSSAGSEDDGGGQQRKSCWSCALTSGGGLIAGGGYVYFHARKFPRPETARLPIAFAIGLAACGIMIISKAAVEHYSKR